MLLIEERIRKIVADEFSTEPEKIDFNHQFIKDLGADSLDLISLSHRIEQEFHINFPNHWPRDFRVLDVVTYVYVNSTKT